MANLCIAIAKLATAANTGSGIMLAEAIHSFADRDQIEAVLNTITIQMGPKVMLAAKMVIDSETSVGEAASLINGFERKLKERFPEIGWCFIEPDNTD